MPIFFSIVVDSLITHTVCFWNASTKNILQTHDLVDILILVKVESPRLDKFHRMGVGNVI